MNVTYAVVITAVLSAAAGPKPVLAQSNPDLLGPCATWSTLTSHDSALADTLLLQIDSMPGTVDMMNAHMELFRQASGSLSYCSIEQRLRRLGAKTYLLAVPYQSVTGPRRGFSLKYAAPRFTTWSRIPRYAVWYERKGREAALSKLQSVGLDEAGNLSRLNRAGVVIEASTQHPNFVLSPQANDAGLPPEYVGLRDILNSYRSHGYLDETFTPLLMHAIDPYVSAAKIKFTINDSISTGHLQIFVIDRDPERILRSFACSCAAIPRTQLILCDKSALAAIATWVTYSGESQMGTVALLNDGTADVLLHWIVGHEIGHVRLGHDYTARFLGFVPGNEQANGGPIVAAQEAAADSFAFANMPERTKAWVHMTTNFVIQQLVQIARQNDSSKSQLIVVHDDGLGHPNLLSRAFSLMHAAEAQEFLLEGYEREMQVRSDGGVDFTGICSLSKLH